MKRIKDFFSKLRRNNTGESIIIDEDQFKRKSSETIMNENIRRYNKMLEDIEKIRLELKEHIPVFDKAAEEFIMFVSIPKEEIVKNVDNEGPNVKTKNLHNNDFMLRRNEFEDKTRNLRAAFDKIAELRKSEMTKYFEAKRLINNNSIIIGEKKHEIEITRPKETIDEINASNSVRKNSVITKKGDAINVEIKNKKQP